MITALRIQKPWFRFSVALRIQKPWFRFSVVLRPQKPWFRFSVALRPQKPCFRFSVVLCSQKPWFRFSVVLRQRKPWFRFSVVLCPQKLVSFQCCFTSTETIRLIRDGDPRTAILTFTQPLSCAKVEGGVRGVGGRIYSTLRASLSGTFLQTRPDLHVTPLNGHSLSQRICPSTLSATSERFGY